MRITTVVRNTFHPSHAHASTTCTAGRVTAMLLVRTRRLVDTILPPASGSRKQPHNSEETSRFSSRHRSSPFVIVLLLPPLVSRALNARPSYRRPLFNGTTSGNAHGHPDRQTSLARNDGCRQRAGYGRLQIGRSVHFGGITHLLQCRLKLTGNKGLLQLSLGVLILVLFTALAVISRG